MAAPLSPKQYLEAQKEEDSSFTEALDKKCVSCCAYSACCANYCLDACTCKLCVMERPGEKDPPNKALFGITVLLCFIPRLIGMAIFVRAFVRALLHMQKSNFFTFQTVCNVFNRYIM